MLVYYAHPQITYDSAQEIQDVKMLQKLGFQVYNPNNINDELKFQEYGMAWFDTLCDGYLFDALFYRPLPIDPNKASSGTGYEANLCAKKGIPVFKITDHVPALTPEETGQYYASCNRDDLAELYPDSSGE